MMFYTSDGAWGLNKNTEQWGILHNGGNLVREYNLSNY